MDDALIVLGILIIVSGLILKHFKMYNGIAGFNSMTEAEKENFEIEKFATLMKNVFLIIGFIIIISSLISKWLNIELLSLIITILAVFFGLAYLIIQGVKFKKNKIRD